MADTGYEPAGSVSNVDFVGGQEWTNPTNAEGVSDTTYAISAGATNTAASVRLIVGGSASGDNNYTDASLPSNASGDAIFGGSSDTWGLTLSSTNINASNFGVAVALNHSAGNTDYLWCTGYGFSVPSGATIDGIQVDVYGYNAGNPRTGYTSYIDSVSIKVYYTASSGPTYTLECSSGSFALTGQSAGLLHNRILSVDSGAFDLSGTSLDLLYGRVLSAQNGEFQLSGASVDLFHNRLLSVDNGEFTLSGQTVSLLYGRVLSVDNGEFILAGQDAALLTNRVLSADNGAFVLTGQDADLLHNRVLSAGSGAFVLAGDDAWLYLNRVLTVDSGTFTLAGQDAALLTNRVLSADNGAFVLTGQDADLLHNRVLSAGSGAFVLAGDDVGLTFGIIIITPDKRAYVILIENRTKLIDAEVRVFTIPADNRTEAIT